MNHASTPRKVAGAPDSRLIIHISIRDVIGWPIPVKIFSRWGGGWPLFDNRALDVIHPDIETSGSLLETKTIAAGGEHDLIGVRW